MRPLLFAAGDVGGARALLPIIALAAARGARPAVLRHGALVREAQMAGDWVEANEVSFSDAARLPKAYVFAGSVSDPIALGLARAAKEAGVPTIFVLDSWSSYTRRLTVDGGPVFSPSVYCVPDQKAKDDALQAGVSGTIEVTGQPAFADVLGEKRAADAQVQRRAHFLLVSEPVEADHGRTRGYTETDVFALVATALQPLASQIEVDLLPHPRDDASRIASIWRACRGALEGTVLGQNTLRSVADYDAVAGMASVLLYRAWLLGQPVLSCQPGLEMPSLRQFGEREGILFIDEARGAAERISAWAGAIAPGQSHVLRPEAQQHAAAAETILRLANESGMRTHDVQ